MGMPFIFGCVLAIGAAVIGYVIYNQNAHMNYDIPNREPPPSYDRYEYDYEPAPQPSNTNNRQRNRRRRQITSPLDECIICMDKLTQVTTKIIKCGHSFHAPCIDKWLNNNRTCPICRSSTI